MFSTMSNRWRRRGWWALVAALLLAGCAGGGPEKTAPQKTVNDWFAIKVGDQTVQMQIAIQAAELEHGLMDRRDLGPDQGMLFVYRDPTAMSFWMRRTPLPLDIGYFSPEGELKEIYGMLPFDETPIQSRDRRLQFALEMNRGWFHNNDVRPGAKLDLAALAAALKARGANLEEFGPRFLELTRP
jgi:uncharacterized protein